MDEKQTNPIVSGEASSPIKRKITKAFFVPALDKATHRSLVYQRVQEIVTNDNSVPPEIIHLGHCGWKDVGQVQSPTYYAMSFCRKYNLFPSERCIMLPLSDQYQAIQLCLAKINKKKNGDFSAPVSDVLDVWNELYRDTVTSSYVFIKPLVSLDEGCEDLNLPSSRRKSHDPVVREMQEIVSSYQEFMKNSGCTDHFHVYNLLKEHLKTCHEMNEELSSKIYVIEGASHMPVMERELMKLFLTDAQVIQIFVTSLSASFSSNNDLDMSGIGNETLNVSVNEAANDQDFSDDKLNVLKDQQTNNPNDQQTNNLNDQQDSNVNKTLQDLNDNALPTIDIETLQSTITSYFNELPDTNPAASDFSESELYIKQLIVCHLRLLINTRDELALAVLCSMPGREITQQGFHDIKEEAQKKHMPMYQTIFSFIMRLRLGGKGYQADLNCPMLHLSKPLGEFVDSIMKLQNIVEEEHCAKKGAMRVLTLIKTGLMRIRGRAIKGACIEKVWDLLKTAFTELTMELEGDGAPVKSNATLKLQQTTGALRPCLKLLVKLCDEASGQIAEEIVDVLGDNFLTQCNSSKKTATPIRIPTVLSLFRSPLNGCSTLDQDKLDEDIENSLRMRLMKCNRLTPKNKTASRFQSTCSWAPADLSPVQKSDGKHDATLSPIVGPTLKAVGNTRKSAGNWREIVDTVAQEEALRSKESSPAKKQNHKVKKPEEKRSKRSLLSDISNITPEAAKKIKTFTTVKKSPTKKKGKNMPLIKGQKSITSFFKV